MTIFVSKAQTLHILQKKIKSAQILDQICFTVAEWNADNGIIFAKLKNKKWLNKFLIIRSSSAREDNESSSLAGHFDSVLNVKGRSEIKLAIDQVVSGFDRKGNKDEIFIQPMLENVKISGVAFTRDPNNNSPYLKINYDDQSGKTDTITSGNSNETKTFYCHKLYKNKFKDFRDKIIKLCF